MADFKNLTTTSGRPVGDNQNVMSVGPRGPLLLQDTWFLEKLAAFDRAVSYTHLTLPTKRIV